MHVQPEAAAVKIANRPLWAPGAPEAIERWIAARPGDVRVLEFGSGGSTLFLLRRGAAVTTVEHHPAWADALQQRAQLHNLAGRLTLMRRDRPYNGVTAEFAGDARFDILLVDGRERMDCLRAALPYVAPDGLVLVDDSQRSRYWPAFALLAGKPCDTYESDARNTTIWALGGGEGDAPFVQKTSIPSEPPREPKPSRIFVPRELLDGSALEPKYLKRAPIDGLNPVEADLQRLRLIERVATFTAPRLYDLHGASLRIEAGRKLLTYNDTLYQEKTGDYIATDQFPAFDGAVELPGRTLDLTASGAGRYSFFLLDSLPKLEILAAAGLSPADFDTVLVNSGAPWVGDILSSALKDRHPKIRSFNKNDPSFRMERSIHIEGLRSARFTPRWVHAYLERVFRGGQPTTGGTDEESFGPYVYISREQAEGRRIVNHDDFLALLGSFGFREIFAEDHSPLQLARRLADVKVLISPHGAGLANLLFCPRSARIVELFSSHFTPQYFHLARDIGQDYSAVACRDAHGLNVFDRYDATTANKAEFNREDIVAPLDVLKEMLTRLC